MLDIYTSPEGQTFRPSVELETRNKYLVGLVTDVDGQNYFLKAAKQPDNPSVRADLQNEVRWNQVIGPQLGEDYWKVPEVVTNAPDFSWAIFEYVEGVPPDEEDLTSGWLSASVRDIGVALYGLPLGRGGTDLASWYQQRLSRFAMVTDTDFFDAADRRAINSIQLDSQLPTTLKAGVVHGDLSPKNLIIASSADWSLYVTDAEFGTLPEKPEWDKPRLHDMAYFYHLLRCQYQRPDIAESFLNTLWTNIQQTTGATRAEFNAEFHLSLLERTISMMSHFVINHTPDKQIDDKRRTEPEPYVQTVRLSLNALTSQ